MIGTALNRFSPVLWHMIPRIQVLFQLIVTPFFSKFNYQRTPIYITFHNIMTFPEQNPHLVAHLYAIWIKEILYVYSVSRSIISDWNTIWYPPWTILHNMQINRMFENQIINKGEQRIDALRLLTERLKIWFALP